MRILPFQVDVSNTIAPIIGSQATLAATLFAPDALPSSERQLTLFCLPGGSYTQAYYDFHLPNETDGTYSFARYMAGQGIMVVTLDHIGLGKSSRVPNGNLLTAEVMSLANHAAIQTIRERLAQGILFPDLPPVRITSFGLGHSMGAYLTIQQQALFRTHEALVILGWSNYALQADDFIQRWAQANHVRLSEDFSAYDVLAQMYQFGEDGYVNVYRPAARGLFYTPDIPEQVIETDTALATVVPAPILREIADLNTIQERAGYMTVPLFLGFGGLLDVSADPAKEMGTYGSNDGTFYILPESAHCHNFASKRLLLWQRIANWAEELDNTEAISFPQHDTPASGGAKAAS